MRAFAVIFLLLAVVLAVDAARDQLSWNCRGFRSTVALLTVFFICSAAVDDIFGSRSQRFGGISRPYGIPVDSCGPLRCRGQQFLAFCSAFAQTGSVFTQAP